MALEALDREIFHNDFPPTASSRRPFGDFTTTVAMHWDGTYRDRVAGPDRRFWPEISGDSPRPASQFAKHLA